MKKNHPQVTPINMPLTVHNIHRVHKICFLHDQTSWKLAPTPNEMLTTNKKNIKKSTSKGEKLWSTRRRDSAVLNPTPSDAWTESHVQRHQKWNGFETRPTKAQPGPPRFGRRLRWCPCYHHASHLSLFLFECFQRLDNKCCAASATLWLDTVVQSTCRFYSEL